MRYAMSIIIGISPKNVIVRYAGWLCLEIVCKSSSNLKANWIFEVVGDLRGIVAIFYASHFLVLPLSFGAINFFDFIAQLRAADRILFYLKRSCTKLYYPRVKAELRAVIIFICFSLEFYDRTSSKDFPRKAAGAL